MTLLKELEIAALRLPEKDRVRLTDRLLRTLPAPDACEPNEILAEADSRNAELERGKVRPLTEAQFSSGVRRHRV
jgi:hypothetical protein